MPRDPFQLSPVVTSQYSKTIFLEKNSGKSPESCPESLPIWVDSALFLHYITIHSQYFTTFGARFFVHYVNDFM